MRLDSPRIPPLQEADWTEEQRTVLEPFAKQGRLYNIYTTLGHNPSALTAFLKWGSYVLRHSSLDARERELVILRIGYLCRAGYEWAQHSRLGKQAGISDAELESIKAGPEADGWNELDRLLLRTADELHRNYFVSDATWRELRDRLTERQCMDLVFIIGHYTQVCMILNTFGIQLDAGFVEDSDLRE
jgi:4-carboxymuconolactone decarboxylase